MAKLDDLQAIKQLDKANVLASCASLAQQCQHAWKEVQSIKTPKDYQEVNKVLVCGMGGSALGAHVIQTLFSLKVPLFIRRDYHLPAWVDKKTLVIISSYSGNTEETLTNAREAVEKGLKCLALTTNGRLKKLTVKHNIPCYQIKPEFNPSNQPRMAIGYSIFGQIALLTKLGLIKMNQKRVNQLVELLAEKQQLLKQAVPLTENPAKQMAKNLSGKAPILIAAEFTKGAVHVFNNQLNENAKNFSTYFYLPELNHHLMEALKCPESIKETLVFLFFDSQLYSDKIKVRQKITKTVVRKNELETCSYQLTGKTKLEQAFELIQFGAYTSFYLSMLNQLDPAPIPWVDYFKKELKKHQQKKE